jgi:L-ascorbate metabolism protein UlaG (beta-lactamase superfamily)
VVTAPALTIRWLGHATVEIGLGGLRILTDPLVTPRVGHLRRRSALDPNDIERPDLVLISHVHQDHLHLPSLRRLGADVPVLVPHGAGGFLHRRGFGDVTETRAGDVRRLGEVTIETVPAVHPRGRGPHSSVAADPVGYVVRSAGGAAYFAGDTDLFDEMAALTALDVALIPIWGWGPGVGEGHLDPLTAARAAELIRPDVVVPVHWGTFTPVGMRRPHWLETPAHRFREALRVAEVDADLRQRARGGSLELITSPSGRAIRPREMRAREVSP